MRQIVKELLQLLLLSLLFAAVVAWCWREHNGPVIWVIRLGTTLGAAVVGWALFKQARPGPERLRDLLGEVRRKYFEQEGLCFAPVVQVFGRQCWLCLYFQNRYARHCSGQIVLKPPLRTLWFTRHNLPSFTVPVECPGGAFGVVRIPFPVPARYQGWRMGYDVGAWVKYRDGRGELLRRRCGVRVGKTADYNSGASFLLLFCGVLYVSRPASCRLILPTGVAESAPPDAAPAMEILWALDLPTGGFPVLPMAA